MLLTMTRIHINLNRLHPGGLVILGFQNRVSLSFDTWPNATRHDMPADLSDWHGLNRFLVDKRGEAMVNQSTAIVPWPLRRNGELAYTQQAERSADVVILCFAQAPWIEVTKYRHDDNYAQIRALLMQDNPELRA